MIKILTIGALLFVLYRMIFSKTEVLDVPNNDPIDNINSDDVIDIEYEDVEPD